MSGMSYPVGRRRFVASAAGALAGLFAGPALLSGDEARPVPRPGPPEPLPADLFRLGVASGEPAPDGMVLWTRLFPTGRMPDRTVEVGWEIADDDRFGRVRQRGTALADPRLAHSVHVEVAGLDPDRWYHYRFRVAGEVSPVGRTRTAPAAGQRVDRLRFALACCQDYQAGYYPAYRHLAAEDIDVVVFLGDYIYEGPPNPAAVRQHDGTGEPVTLAQYRDRYACYRRDPDLRAAHAAAPWIVTFDDHEVDNNWSGDQAIDPDQQSREAFRRRRGAAFQAYFEHLPLRRSAFPHRQDMRIHRRLTFGQLATLHVLDTRQYRSHQPGSLAAANEPDRTMTGAAQERWLLRGLSEARTRWNLIANQTQLASNDHTPGPEQTFDFDNWDGYRAQRRRLLEFLGTGRAANPVVLTGDRHATWVSDLRPDFDEPTTPAVAAEFVTTSISSNGDPDRARFAAIYRPLLAESPHWKYIDNRRGYYLGELTPDGLTVALRVVDTVRVPDARIATAGRFRVEAGLPGVTVVDHDA